MTNETTTHTFEQFFTNHPVTMRAERIDSNPHMDNSREMDHWLVTLRYQGRRMSLVFSMGFAHKGKAPSPADVLDCLASDAAGVEGRSFEEWAEDYGYDTDSRKALKTYHTIVRQMRSLGRLLGADAYSELLWNTERL